MATRNEIITALVAKLTAAWPFVVVTRRNRDPKQLSVADTPAMIVVELPEDISRPSPDAQPKITLNVAALIYVDVGPDENAIPAAVLDDILDAVFVALAPDSPAFSRQTLGGLVQWCMISGQIDRSSGDLTGKAAAAIPIEILIP